ncbi:MAG: CHAD domain-containing protein [Pseudomonadales bacterium]
MERTEINKLTATVSASPRRAIHTARIAYVISGQVSIDDVLTQLQQNTRLVVEPARVVRRTFYDTFDWRLYADNAVLEERQDGKQRTLLWHNLEAGDRGTQIASPAPPRFVKDLPTGQFRQRLERVVEMRELMPVLQISTKTRALRMLDKIDKTVVRLVVEEGTARRHRRGKAHPLADRISVLPLRGYQKPFAKIISKLEKMGLTPATEDPVLTALALVGHTPGDYSSKLNLQLEPDLRSDQAIRIVLQRLLDIMLANEAGTLAGTDTEFLHDFRVAVRRTRSALSQIKAVLPLRVLNRYQNEFAWLGEITSPLRDLDVYLLKFDDYRDSLPESVRADIEPLRDFLLRQRQTEHKALTKALSSARYRRLIKRWREFLKQPVNERSTLKNASRPIIDLARERIWRTYRRILKEGEAIDTDTAAEALHDLRKSCKKLRYLMEFFQSLFPPEKIKKLIKTLKSLQENLGDFQDYEVQVMTLKQFSQRMVAEAAAPAATLLTMGMLIEGLERRQQQARDEFADRFQQFALPKNRARFQTLFAAPKATKRVGDA